MSIVLILVRKCSIVYQQIMGILWDLWHNYVQTHAGCMYKVLSVSNNIIMFECTLNDHWYARFSWKLSYNCAGFIAMTLCTYVLTLHHVYIQVEIMRMHALGLTWGPGLRVRYLFLQGWNIWTPNTKLGTFSLLRAQCVCNLMWGYGYRIARVQCARRRGKAWRLRKI
jgi:hypothetical protein